jgi:D-alanine-D-alanine ligase
MKIRVGIIFGGASREREISFAGGRTVFDNLDKSLFEAVPIFVDSFNNLILVNWEFIYKGSIRDFYPPSDMVPPSPNDFQVYAESLGEISQQEQLKYINRIGSRVDPSSLSSVVDFAFLCLHGSDGEDGRIQGMLEFYRIPYSGSGIYSSSIGMNKCIQKKMMLNNGFEVPLFLKLERSDYVGSESAVADILEMINKEVGFPCVVKSATQGSSIGVSVVEKSDLTKLKTALDKSFFIKRIHKVDWEPMSFGEKVDWIKRTTDIREGIGIPLRIGSKIIFHPEELMSTLNQLFSEPEGEIILESVECENDVVVEKFIEGKEFSCIVIEDEHGTPIALPPTEIRKGREVYDYRSKYLPGLSRKITPIDLPEDQIQTIRIECQQLFTDLKFSVYARIDGFIMDDGKVFLNDPNTTSGMLPSSFFFHQAAEIGLNPSQFITYIIRRSIAARVKEVKSLKMIPWLGSHLDRELRSMQSKRTDKEKIAVIMGGYSSERHISVESGRNVYEKLSSSEKYLPVPVFLSGTEDDYMLYIIPVNLLLKDNADDIREKIDEFSRHPVVDKIIHECREITAFFSSSDNLAAPRQVTVDELASVVNGVFIALHGRPGEDGAIQKDLEKAGLPYNGSGIESSRTTIDKFLTNEILMENGMKAARHRVVTEGEWRRDPAALEEDILTEFSFPFIVKPVDDGCSSAVKIIRDENQFHAFAELIFRKEETLAPAAADLLKLKHNEEFPKKKVFLLEELVTRGKNDRLLEITGGLVTSMDERGNVSYEVFEASEALSVGDVLSLEEKFLAGEGQNITPARYDKDPDENRRISSIVKNELEKAAKILNVEGYARIDAFVRIHGDGQVDVLIIEVNSLPGMTPATCIFHQAAINHYKPYEFIDKILEFGKLRQQLRLGNFTKGS